MENNKFLEKFRKNTKSELLEILDNRDSHTSDAIEAVEIVLKEKYNGKPLIKEPDLKNETKDLKFYSQKAIGIATFIGGPLAAGYLVRENYLSLNNSDEGKKSLFIGIISTILLFTGIFMVPESIMDKVPNQILPAIYTGIIYLIVEKIHGKILNQHKENGNEFYSGWKAAGIGLISMLILIIGVFGYSFFSVDDEVYEQYDTQMAIFLNNEAESLVFYDNLNTKPNFVLISELDNDVIPKWKDNIEIIKKSNDIENLPSELLEQNIILIKYSELRLRAFELFKKAINEDTEKYSQELEQIHLQIDKQLEKLN